MKSRTAATGAAIRNAQPPAPKSESAGMAQKIAEMAMRPNRPVQRNGRRVLGFT